MRGFEFFGSNPAARPPEGPRNGPWRRDLPRNWREALGLDVEGEEEPAAPEAPHPAGDAAAQPPVRGS